MNNRQNVYSKLDEKCGINMELFRSKIKNFPENRILNILSIPN